MNLDILLPVALVSGFLGGGHCLGMCGPVVVLLESPSAVGNAGPSLPLRLAYNLGRMSFYILLGVVAGAAGTVLTKIGGVDSGLRVLRVLAAALIVALGINLLFNVQLLRLLESGGSVIWRRLAPLARYVIPMSSWPRALAAGALWGALPCGLVYSAVAVAATSGSGAAGGLVMAAFWLGTLPALLFAGASAGRLDRWRRNPLLRRLTGAALVAVGLFALGMPFLHGGGHEHGDRSDAPHTHSADTAPGEAAATPASPFSRRPAAQSRTPNLPAAQGSAVDR